MSLKSIIGFVLVLAFVFAAPVLVVTTSSGQAKEATVLILDQEIDDDVSQRLVDKILSVPNDDAIELVINSPGGSVQAGQVIENALELHRGPVRCVAAGMVASMALDIFEDSGCKVREATVGVLLLGHQPSSAARGQIDKITDEALLLRALEHAMALKIASRTRMSVEQWESAVAGGHLLLLTSSTAMWWGFADAVVAGL